MMWQPSTFGGSRHVPSSAIAETEENERFWAYRAHFCFDFAVINIHLKGLLCIFCMCNVFLMIFMLSLFNLHNLCKIHLNFRFFNPKIGVI